jgi:DNA-binding MurR/RpiR family transcriptional regulator
MYAHHRCYTLERKTGSDFYGVSTRCRTRVALVVRDDPEAVAFGTVANIARLATTSGATVVRTSGRLGYPGFSGLQEVVRQDLARRLHPASPQRNPAATLDVLSRSFDVAQILAARLAVLCSGVELVGCSDAQRGRVLAHTDSLDVVLALDVSPHDGGLRDAVDRAASQGVQVVSLTDSLSPLTRAVPIHMAVAATGVGPFDTQVGMLALVNALVADVADRLHRNARTPAPCRG